VLAISPRHPLAGGGSVTFAEVRRRGGPLLLVRWGAAMRAVLSRLGDEQEGILEVPVETIRPLLLQGTGMAFLTRTLVAEDIAAGRLATLDVRDLPPMHSDSMLVCRASSTSLPAAVRDFVLVVQEEAGDLYVPNRGEDEVAF
jgi:DNA-binding transcriptional LysR family regulator